MASAKAESVAHQVICWLVGVVMVHVCVANSGNATSSTAAALNDPQLSAKWSGVAQDTCQTCWVDVFAAASSACVSVKGFAHRLAAADLSIVIPKLQQELARVGRQPWSQIKCEMNFALSVWALRSSAASSSAGEAQARRAGVPHTTATPSMHLCSATFSIFEVG
eukprot:2311018-Rhodomonas_salina.1